MTLNIGVMASIAVERLHVTDIEIIRGVLTMDRLQCQQLLHCQCPTMLLGGY